MRVILRRYIVVYQKQLGVINNYLQQLCSSNILNTGINIFL